MFVGLCSFCLSFGVFLFSYDRVYLVLDLLRMILLIFLVICKDCIERWTMVIARAHFSQPKIVHPSRVYTFDMSIVGIRHVDSWGAFGTSIVGVWYVDSCGVASLISMYAIGAFEHWANNDFYVIWSTAILLFSEMLVQFGLLVMSSISFFASKIIKFYVLNDKKTNHQIAISMLFVLSPHCIDSWGFIPAILYSS